MWTVTMKATTKIGGPYFDHDEAIEEAWDAICKHIAQHCENVPEGEQPNWFRAFMDLSGAAQNVMLKLANSKNKTFSWSCPWCDAKVEILFER